MLRLIPLFLIPLVAFSVAQEDRGYIQKMIEADEPDERYIGEAYDAFLTLIAEGELAQGELRHPLHMTKQRDRLLIIYRGFYVSPNELRGFELLIPEGHMEEVDGILISTVRLSVAHQQTQQGLTSLRLARAGEPDGGVRRR